MNSFDLILIIPKDETEQTLESVLALPYEIQENLSEYCLTLEEFIHCINVANGLTDRNMDGEYKVSKEFIEMAEDVMDSITCGSYFVIKQHHEEKP